MKWAGASKTPIHHFWGLNCLLGITENGRMHAQIFSSTRLQMWAVTTNGFTQETIEFALFKWVGTGSPKNTHIEMFCFLLKLFSVHHWECACKISARSHEKRIKILKMNGGGGPLQKLETNFRQSMTKCGCAKLKPNRTKTGETKKPKLPEGSDPLNRHRNLFYKGHLFGHSWMRVQIRSLIGLKTRRPTSWWGSPKREVTHPTATVVYYNACYHLLRKRSCITV